MKLFSKVISLFKRVTPRKAVRTRAVRSLQEKRQVKVTGRFVGFIPVVLLALFCVTVLSLSIRGIAGNPTPAELNNPMWKDEGPLELSPERGRYALLYSVIEHDSVFFTSEIAKFATPDVGYKDGKYVSLFAPGVSYIVIPGYLYGKSIGLAQVGAFAVVALFAFFNFFLIRAIAIRLGAAAISATLGAMAFLFGSPAYAYAVTLYQHHISTFLILLSIYLLVRSRSVLSLSIIWIMCGLSIAVDYPNFFMMLSIGVVALARSVLIERTAYITKVSLHLLRVFTIVAIILPASLLMWFNKETYGNPLALLALTGSVERSVDVKSDGQPLLESEVYEKQLEKEGHKNTTVEETNVGTYFNPRKLMDGFYTHFFSPDRGMIMYTPVMIFGFIGFFFFKRNKNVAALIIGVIGFNVVLYSMWGDPYGGWAFGSRYLIPTYALLGISIGMLLTTWNRQIIFIILFLMMYSYSVGVNTLGAITSNRNPPQVEAAGLEQKSGIKQEFTYVRNLQVMDSGVSKSYVYQTYAAKYMSPREYFTYLTLFIIFVSIGLLGYQTITAIKNKKHITTAEVKARVVQRRKGGHVL